MEYIYDCSYYCTPNIGCCHQVNLQRSGGGNSFTKIDRELIICINKGIGPSSLISLTQVAIAIAVLVDINVVPHIGNQEGRVKNTLQF